MEASTQRQADGFSKVEQHDAAAPEGLAAQAGYEDAAAPRSQDSRAQQVAQTEQDGPPQPGEPGFEEAFAALRRFVYSSPLTREMFYRMLTYCRIPRLEADLEDHILTFLEFKSARQSQYVLIMWLVEKGGLIKNEIDGQGEVIDADRKLGLSEDEIDDLVAGYTYQSSPVGLALAEEMDPKHRLMGLLNIVPEHYETYVEVLEFLGEKKSFAKVNGLLRGRAVLTSGRGATEEPLQPSVFIDKLEKAGGIVWQDGWMTTREGKELLETIKARVPE
jgi:hypothetical protein